MDITAERREATKTKLFVTIDGDEYEAARVLEFVRTVMGTDGFVSGVRNVTGIDRDIAETLEETGAVSHTHSAGWFEDDEEQLNELFTELMVLHYDSLDPSDVSAEDWR